MIARERFVEEVRRLVGAKVVHRGRSRAFGVDCVGVPIAALARCGLCLPDDQTYGLLPEADQLAAGLARYCDPVGVDQLRAGDVLQVMAGEQARHVAVAVEDRDADRVRVVHAMGKFSSVREVWLTLGRVRAIWRIREVG